MNMKQRKLSFFFALLFTALFALPQAALAQQCYQTGSWQGNEVEYVKRQVVIQLAPLVTPSDAAPILNRQSVEIIDQFDELNWGLGQVPEGHGIFSVIEALNRSPLIANAEPNVVGHLMGTPNDNHFSKQWGLVNTSSNTGEEDADIDADLAWDLTTGSSEAAIAVIDSGIPMQDDNGDGTYDEDDLSHPDLETKAKLFWVPTLLIRWMRTT